MFASGSLERLPETTRRSRVGDGPRRDSGLLLARAGHSIYLPFFDYGGFPGLDVGEAG